MWMCSFRMRAKQQIAGTNDLKSAIDTLAQMVPVLASKQGVEVAIARRGSAVC